MDEKPVTETPRRIIGRRPEYWDSILIQEMGAKFAEYRNKWKRVSSRELVTEFPLYIQVEHSGRCNLRCIQCIQGIEELRNSYSKGFSTLDIKLYKKVLDEAREYGCPSISFHNNDEPLLLKDLELRIALAKESGFIDLLLVTNATLLTPERAERILKSGITKISFSVDACEESLYQRIRIGGDFNSVLKNIEHFMNLRRSLGLRIPIARVAGVFFEPNSKYMDRFREFWESRVDIVELQNFQAIKGYTEALRADGAVVDENFTCNAPWQQVVIRPNGDILPCCSFYGTELVLGNTKDSSLYDVWHGYQMRKIREELGRNNYSYSPACKKCSETFYIIT